MQSVRKKRTLMASLVGFVLFSLASSAIAATICPHNDRDSCCLSEDLLPSTDVAGESVARLVEAGAHGAVGQNRKVVSKRTAHCATPKRQHSVLTDAFSRSANSCSDCLSESRSREVVSSAFNGQTSRTRTSIALCTSIPMIAAGFRRSAANLHDHSPPGSLAPRHLLNSVFQI